jgi:hypothetical protein
MALRLASHPYPSPAELPRWVVVGALSGTVSTIIFPHGAFGPVPLAVWGAIWGALLAATLGRLTGKRLILAAAGFGALVPTLVALAFVARLHGQPPVTGVVPSAILVAAVVNGAWGFATGIGLALFGRR